MADGPARFDGVAVDSQNYPATFFACALTFAHRFFAALAIAARPAAGCNQLPDQEHAV